MPPLRASVLNVGVVAALPLLLVSMLVLWRGLEEKKAQVAEAQEARAQVAALTAEAFFSGNLSILRSLALSIPLLDASDATVRVALFNRLLAENPDWLGASIIGPDGWNVASSSAAPPRTIYVGDRPYFLETLATGQSQVSTAVIGRVSGEPTTVITSILTLSTGERTVLVATLPMSRLATTLRAQVETGTVRVVLVDASGQTVVDPDPRRVAQLASRRGDLLIEAALDGQAGSEVAVRDGVESVVAYAPVPGYRWGVLVLEPTTTAFAAARQDALRWLGLVQVSVALVAGISWWFSNRLSASFQREVEARAQAERATAEAEAARQRLAFMAEASARLSAAVEYERTLTELAQLAVPSLADWCLVDVLDEQGPVRRLAPAHEASAAGRSIAELLERYARAGDPPDPVAEVLRTRRGQIFDGRSGELLLPGAPPEVQEQLAGELRLGTAIVVPLVARDRILGALTLIAAESGRRFGSSELTFANNLAGRAAMLIDNARLYDQVQHALQTRDEFLAAASHDLRNPLAAVKGTAQILRRQLTRDGSVTPERLDGALSNIDAASNRMTALVDSLLDLAHLQMGQPLELQRAPTDLVALVAEVVAQCQETTDRHDVHLEAISTLHGEWDAPRLQRVVANLLDNAVKYSPGGGVIEVKITREEDGPAAVALLTVRDHGIGIPAADLPRIFERFRRGSNVVGKVAGTGIGLASARQIVEQHGGTVAVSSEVGDGVLVTVRLPLTPPLADIASATKTGPTA